MIENENARGADRCWAVPGVGRVQASRQPSPALVAALSELVDAARAAYGALPAAERDELEARQAAARERSRERLERARRG